LDRPSRWDDDDDDKEYQPLMLLQGDEVDTLPFR
jgi:hypothetical protein